MEGPTPSSAIFYGSLSVHLGVFLLLRTHPFWEHQIFARVMIGLIGLISAAVGASIGRVQSSIKSQIAYASIAQIGLIFIELSLGLYSVALVHFAGNAFLTTYHVLVSPSAVSYLIREQFYHFEPKHQNIETKFSKKIEYTLFLLSIKEYNMDELLDKFLWKPFKNLGNTLRFINISNLYYITLATYFAGLAETLAEKPSFHAALKRRRCLVPASAFFEWREISGQTKKQKLRFTSPDAHPLALAGLWEHWQRPETGELVESFTVITTSANDFMAPIHDRLPVILGKADWEAWLDQDTGNPLLLHSMLKPCPDDWLECSPA